ncbi:MAG: PAS domain S-box protein, partial [Smithellaceae bacterium]
IINVTAVDIIFQGKACVLSFVQDITQKKRIEQTLRESEALYRTAMEKTNDGISIIQDGKYVYANQKLLKTIGREETGILGLPLGCYTHPDDRRRVWQNYEERLEGKKAPLSYNVRIIKPDGTVLTLRITAANITYLGKPATIAFALDVTEQKKAEDALRESEELYRTAMETTNDGISIIQDGKYVFVNQNLLNIIGREDADLIGKPLGIFTHPDDRNVHRDYYKNRQAGKDAPASYDLRVLKPDGSIVTINITAVIANYKGKPSTISFIQDVTRRRRDEEALRASEERYRTIIESIDDDYFETDLKGTITFINRPFGGTGHRRQELIGMNHRRYTAPEMAEKIKVAFHHVYQTGKPARITDFEIIRRDGSIGHLEMSVSLMRDAEGNPTGFRGISRDVTERFHMDSEHKKLTEQLYQAQKMEAIGTLAGGIAHDFNNLLMGIQGYTSLMLLEVDENHPYFAQLTAVQTLVQSGATLTKQLLGFARAGRYEVVSLNLNDFISKSVSLFGRTRKEIRIFEKYSEGLWAVEADRGQMEQVLLNMFVNAWQAMPGGGSLYLETENVVFDEALAKTYDLQSGRYVKVSITDTGLGMDESTRKRIFDPFFTTKEMGRGTGLGLASAYGIVKGHSGAINVYSEPGQGTTFNIYLPATSKAIATEEPLEREPSGGRETILLVDDEAVITEVTGRLLAELGYTILTASSGDEAVALYARQHKSIDLVMVDMIMPGMSGSDTFDALKAVNPDVRVILSSGYSLNSKAQAIMDRGVRTFLQKPYRLQDLAQKIREALTD